MALVWMEATEGRMSVESGLAPFSLAPPCRSVPFTPEILVIIVSHPETETAVVP